jgi:two-component SAPR family response regulator
VGQALSGYVVLVVENDYLIASGTAEALARAGATILGPCATVDAAVRLIEETSPSHAVLDLNLDGSGARFEFARQLQSREIKCVIVSGYDKETLPNDLTGLPFLMKPVPYDQLVNVFAALPADY